MISIPRFTIGRTGLAGLALAACLCAVAPTANTEERMNDCYAPASVAAIRAPLEHTGQRLLRGEPVTIVAFGSSSTAGAGASDAAHSYPAQLAQLIHRRYPDSHVAVLNKGVNGEQSKEMLARLERDVIAIHPDLVIWQTGSNEILKRGDPALFRSQTLDGLARLKAAGIEVILMDSQYTPRILDNPDYKLFNDSLRSIARAAHVALFDRFKAMEFWFSEDRRDWSDMLSPDLVHLNDHGYSCVAQLVTALISSDLPPAVAAR